jgi:hypothetical protein
VSQNQEICPDHPTFQTPSQGYRDHGKKLTSELLIAPERVRKGNFVLNLSKGVTKPDETLDEYVVTPQLVECFDKALCFIRPKE